MTFGGWGVSLNGLILTEPCASEGFDCLPGFLVYEGLDASPDGTGLPDLRTEDVVYAQRDGVKHFSDWYEPRIITLTGMLGPADDSCAECTSVRQQAADLIQAWKRGCCDTELVLYPPCAPGETSEDRIVTGPYGVVGRPRVAQVRWMTMPDGRQAAQFLLRFDGVDQRLYVLDECGTPAYSECVDVLPGSSTYCREYPRCYHPDGMCYPNLVGTPVPPTFITIGGTEAVSPTITFYPSLTRPAFQNLTTGETLRFRGPVTGNPVVVDTEQGTATQGGADVTYLLSGAFMQSLPPGTYEIRLTSSGSADDGYMNVCWRDTVLMA